MRKFLSDPFILVFRHRGILFRTTATELKAAYAGSLGGMLWLVLGPLLLLTVYALVFAVIFRVRPAGMNVAEYVLYVFSGLVPFIAFSNSLTGGALSLATQRHLLLNTVFPVELIPLRSVLVGSVLLPAGLFIVLAGDAAFSSVSATWLVVPLIVILQLMFVVGVCWMLSLATLVLRDVQQFLVYLVMLLLVVTPIAYTPEMIPPALNPLLYFNPLFYFVTAYQSLIILDAMPEPVITATAMMLGLGFYLSGFAIYRRAKQVFYDFA